MAKISKTELLEREAIAYVNGDLDAVNRLHPLIDKMVWDLAHKYGKDNLSKVEEYHQLGWCGVMKALKNYNPNNEKGAKFITFSHICATQAIVQDWRKNKKHENEYDENNEPIRVISSLDATVSEDGLTLGEYIPSDNEPLDEYAIEVWEKEFVRQQLEQASPEVREIVRLSIQGVPQADIAKVVGMQQCHVSKRYRQFIRKCQRIYKEGEKKSAKANKTLF